MMKYIRPEQVLPTILMLIDIGAGIVYACNGSARKTIYWLAAAALTASVTY